MVDRLLYKLDKEITPTQWRDGNLIVTLSFVDSMCKFDLTEIFLELLLSANARFNLAQPLNGR